MGAVNEIVSDGRQDVSREALTSLAETGCQTVRCAIKRVAEVRQGPEDVKCRPS